VSGGSSSSSGFDNWRPTSGSARPSGPRGDGSGGAADGCAIVEQTVLASPVANVVATLAIGDTLTVGLETTPRNRVVVRTIAGQVVGAITSVQLVDMIECMQGGYQYEAEVLSVSGGRVEVQIRPV
jgi:hypothetical protein